MRCFNLAIALLRRFNSVRIEKKKKNPYLHFGDGVERMPVTKLQNMNMLLIVVPYFIKIDSKNTKENNNTKLSSQG